MSRKFYSYRCILLAFFFSVTAMELNAENQPPAGFYFNPHLSAIAFDEDRGLKDDMYPGLGFGYQFNSPWAVEFNFVSKETEVDGAGSGKVDFEQMRIDGLYHFAAGEKLQPYLAFGIGENQIADFDETIINAGAGLNYKFNQIVSLRSDIRLINSIDEEDQDLMFNIGLRFAVGATTSSKPVVSKPVAPIPTDGDSDGDGVTDNNDRCPNTPANTPVDTVGCPLDSDKDGVIDARDACPGSEAGARVDERGCYIVLQETRTIELEINFANNSSEITEEYMDQIQQVSDFMREYPLTKVVVEGHTDDRGQADYNQQLSERRAQAVANVLMTRFNINADRVSAVGKGEAEPIATNDTAEGRATNRRVVGVISATVETRAQ